MFQEEIDKDLLEAAQEVENKYQEFFRSKMDEYGIESPNELSYEDRKKFFDDIEKEWHKLKEENKEESLNEGFNDVYADLYNNLVNPQINKVGDIVSFPYNGYDTQFEIKLIVEPVKFGDSSTYYLKVLNGPYTGDQVILPEEAIKNGVNKLTESEEQEIIDILDELVGPSEENNITEEVEDIKENEEDVIVEDNEEELTEATDIDVTNTNNDKLEDVLKMFIDKKAEDGEDYELVSRGNKLILKIYNKKFDSEVKKLLKEDEEEI